MRAAIIMAVIVPCICFAADPAPLPPPDPLQAAFESIRQMMERSRMMDATLGGMTTPEVYDFYTRRNDLYKHNLMKALGAYNALAFLRPIEEARGMDPMVIIRRLQTETDPTARTELMGRIPQSAVFDAAGAEAAIRRRIGELGAEAAKLKIEEEKYRKEMDRIESDLTAAKHRVPRNTEEIQAILEEKWGVLEKIETIHRRLVELAIEGNLLRDYVLATNKDAKMAGIARGLGNDLRLFVGEVRDGEPMGGMRKLWADIQANIAANRQRVSMPFQPGQAFFLNRPGSGVLANPVGSGFSPSFAPPPASAYQPLPFGQYPIMVAPLALPFQQPMLTLPTGRP